MEFATTPPPAKRNTTARQSAPKKADSAQLVAQNEAAKEDRIKTRAEGVAGLFTIAQMATLATGQLADFQTIEDHGPRISREAALIAEHNEKFGQTLDRMAEVSPYAGLLMAVLPFALQIMTNHGMLKGKNVTGVAGVVAPEVLETRARTAIAQAQAEAIRTQQEAERDLAELKAQNGTQ